MKRLPTKWKTKDGRIVPINRMSDSHLVNTILYLRKQEKMKHEVLAFQEFEAQLAVYSTALSQVRGDAATDALNDEISRLTPARYRPEQHLIKHFPPYVALIQEAERRSEMYECYDATGFPEEILIYQGAGP